MKRSKPSTPVHATPPASAKVPPFMPWERMNNYGDEANGQRAAVSVAVGKMLALHHGYVPQAWAPHLTGVTRSAITQALTRRWPGGERVVASVQLKAPDGAVLRLVRLEDVFRIERRAKVKSSW